MKARRPAVTLRIALALGATWALTGCALNHSAPLVSRALPPPPGPHVVHRGRLLVVLDRDTKQTQCARNDKYRPVCFEDVRIALRGFLEHTFWPSFREVRVGEPKDAERDDYILTVAAHLETLPPDQDGPGWSVGLKAHYRLEHEGRTLVAESLASRSRADYPYGEPLREGAADTLAAVSYHIGTRVCQTAEANPEPPPQLPEVRTLPLSKR
jgi:hypothetical protein